MIIMVVLHSVIVNKNFCLSLMPELNVWFFDTEFRFQFAIS